MKRKLHIRSIVGAALLASLALAACDTQELEDFSLEHTSSSSVSAGAVSGGISKDAEYVNIPVSVTLSTPASKAFQVGLVFDPEATEHLAESQPAGEAVATPSEMLIIPNVVEIPFGAEQATFEISANTSFLEKHYGKKAAVVIQLAEAGKGNQIDPDGSVSAILLNTLEILSPEDIRYVTVTNGGGEILEARNRQNYVSTSSGLTVPIGVSLVGVPSRPFTVGAVVHTDTIAKMVAAGLLPANTVALASDEYSLDGRINMGSNSRSANLELSVPWQVIENNMDKLLAVAISLREPTLHQLHPERYQTVLLIHPEHVVDVDVTGDGMLSVSRDNNGGPENGEGSPKIVDNDVNSKFLQSDFSGDLWLSLEFVEPVVVGAYTMTSANDAPDRDAKNWTLQGSNNGINWTTLDTRNDESFQERFQTKRYDFNNNTAYQYYQLSITANHGSSLYQQAEWRLLRLP